jgi:hypothetical protein
MANETNEQSEELSHHQPSDAANDDGSTLENGTTPKGVYKKERKRRTDLSLEEQERLEKIEAIIKPLADSRLHHGRILPRGALTRAVPQLQEIMGKKVGVDNVREMADKYNVRREKYKEEPDRWCECFIDNRGRPEGTHDVLTEDHIAAILLSLMDRKRVAVSSDGEKDVVELQPGIDITEDVYEYAKAIEPDLPSVHTVRREVKRIFERDPSYTMYITDQQDTLLRIAIPKRKSDVSRVDEHWVLDEHFLPIYIQHNGIICTASLLDLSDQFSDFHIHRVVFPTKERSEDGHVYKAGFTKEDAATFYATAMYKPDRSPECFYNDNDKRFVHMQQHLPRLTASDESAIQMHISIAGQPWGRGRKERLYRTLKRFLKRLPGYYNKRNRFTIRKAIQDPSKLLTLEQLQRELDVFFDGKDDNDDDDHEDWAEEAWNDQVMTIEVPDPNGNTQKIRATRRDLFYRQDSGRKCPRVWRLAFLPLQKEDGWVAFDHWGFDFHGEDYEPTVEHAQQLDELVHHWANAALRETSDSRRGKKQNAEPSADDIKNKVRYYAVKLDTGWVVEVNLDGTWYRAIPKREIPFTVEEWMEARGRMQKKLRERRESEREQLIQRIIDKRGALPERLNATVSGKYRLPKEHAQGDSDTHDSAEDTAVSSQPSPAKAGATGQQKKTSGRKTASSKPEEPIDTSWDDLF